MSLNLPAAGLLQGERHLLPVRVYYEDTDFSGVVYHASYLRFLERGRTEFIRAVGVDQHALHREAGLAFVVRRLAIEFLRPAMMDDAILVETHPREARGPLLQLDQRILRGEETLTTAEVSVVCVKGGRPQRLPEALRTTLLGAQAVPER
jgi:acyl-CoA thioester hydrolase